MDKQSKVSPSLRHYHRISVSLSALLETESGDQVRCDIANLSRAGMMALCTAEMIACLLPNQEPVAPHLAVPLEVSLDLPGDKGQPHQTINAQCDIIYSRRASRDCFHLGMSFMQFHGDDGLILEDFVTRNMGPPTPPLPTSPNS